MMAERRRAEGVNPLLVITAAASPDGPDCSRRAQWYEPPQASRANTAGGSLPKKVIRSLPQLLAQDWLFSGVHPVQLEDVL